MAKDIYVVYFYTGLWIKEIYKFHNRVYLSEDEALSNAEEEIAEEKLKSGINMKFKVVKLEIYESNSMHFIKSDH